MGAIIAGLAGAVARPCSRPGRRSRKHRRHVLAGSAAALPPLAVRFPGWISRKACAAWVISKEAISPLRDAAMGSERYLARVPDPTAWAAGLISRSRSSWREAQQVRRPPKMPRLAVPIIAAGTRRPLVELGLVANFAAAPGVNPTGFVTAAPATPGKPLQIMADIVPQARRAAVLWTQGAGHKPLR